MFPADYRNQIFIAEHGSWNRFPPIGYRITAGAPARRAGGKLRGVRRRLAAGRSAWGRPVDVQVMPDGALLVSDDKAGVIYRISYQR